MAGISVTVGEMVASLERVAAPRCLRECRSEPDARIERMVRGWPGAGDNTRARALGLPVDQNMDAIIRQYMEDRSAIKS